jgi:hypothetical protein
VFVALLIAGALQKWGAINIPLINLSIAAAVSAGMKALRDKYPNNVILTWLPL